MGNEEMRKFAASVFTRQAPSLRLTAYPEVLTKTEALSFTVSIYADGGRRGRAEGIKLRQMTARSDEAPLQLFGVPVFGGEQMRGAREVKQRKCESREDD